MGQKSNNAINKAGVLYTDNKMALFEGHRAVGVNDGPVNTCIAPQDGLINAARITCYGL